MKTPYKADFEAAFYRYLHGPFNDALEKFKHPYYFIVITDDNPFWESADLNGINIALSPCWEGAMNSIDCQIMSEHGDVEFMQSIPFPFSNWTMDVKKDVELYTSVCETRLAQIFDKIKKIQKRWEKENVGA